MPKRYLHWRGLSCQTMFTGRSQLGEKTDMSAAIKRFKACSARRVNEYLKRQGTLWQKSFYDHALRQDEDVRGIARYIVANRLRAGLVEHIGEYPLWDAIWL
jgi:REP element-mobilizing transposase RayT